MQIFILEMVLILKHFLKLFMVCDNHTLHPTIHKTNNNNNNKEKYNVSYQLKKKSSRENTKIICPFTVFFLTFCVYLLKIQAHTLMLIYTHTFMYNVHTNRFYIE